MALFLRPLRPFWRSLGAVFGAPGALPGPFWEELFPARAAVTALRFLSPKE